jgi:hypothetical protein
MSVRCANPKEIHDACKEAVVDSLLNNLSARLAGRGEFYPMIYGSKPSAVLMSEFLLPMPQEERDNNEEADPIRISSHGVDFQIDRAVESARIEVRLRGAVYVRILPRAEELQPGAILEPKFPLTKEIRKELKARIREQLARLRAELGLTARGSPAHPDWVTRSTDVRRQIHESLGIPFDNSLDRTNVASESDDETPDPTDSETEDAQAPPPLEAPVGTGMPDRVAEPIPPPPKWLRLELKLPTFSFAVRSAEQDAARATSALNSAIAEQLQAWAASVEEPTGGQLWGFRTRKPIHPSHVRDWSKYMDSVRASGPPSIPTLQLHWDVHTSPDPLDDGRTTIHVALENLSDPPRTQDRKELERSLFQVAMSATLPASIHRALKLDRVRPSYRYNEYLHYPALGFNGGVEMTRANGQCTLTTTWSPRYVLPRIIPAELASQGVCSNIALLAREENLKGLEPLVAAYESWLKRIEHHPVDRGLEGPDVTALKAKEQEQLQRDIAAWRKELESIRVGIEILKKSAARWSGPGTQRDPMGIPFEAWLSMNAAMAEVAKAKNYTEWRLFQLAFILASIPAFATRIPEFRDFYTPEVAEQANAVTLLYFATGGGKSEAFLGLLLFVLFLDRQRGKHHGVSALMRYPLRLLTLQQARRTFVALAAAENVRWQRKHPGEVFSLGFWVGSTNTPNWHRDEGYSAVPTVHQQPLASEPSYQDEPPYKGYKERWLKLDGCPFCGVRGKLALRRVEPAKGNTLGHFCTAAADTCSWNRRFPEPRPLPFFIVDEDIYDLVPTVLLGTVDKLAALGQSQGTIRKFFGLFGFAPLIETATDRLHIPRKAADWSGEPGNKMRAVFPSYADGEKRFFDPFPALLIQDEAHLLDESLGTFAGLFESALDAAFDRLSVLLGKDQFCVEPHSGVRRRIKVIAASATVNEPHRHMRNLYQRGTVQFPYPGPHLYRSFYAEPQQPDETPQDEERRTIPTDNVELRSHWARVYTSVLTNGHRHTVGMASVLGHYHLAVTGLYERLRSGETSAIQAAREELVRWVTAGPLHPQLVRLITDADPATLLTLIDLHRISLTYVTNKKGGDQVIDTEKVQFTKLHQANGYPDQALSSELISGAVSAAEIQRVVRRAEDRVRPGADFPHLNDTLRSVIATSAISHGIDVEEFNAMFFAGMPSDIAEYIQASSRVGRMHVGFALLVPVPQRYRDRFILEIHDIFHRFLERMILPAAVDRWAEKALVRVLPSFFQEFVCGVNAIEKICAAEPPRKPDCKIYARTTDARDFLANSEVRSVTQRFLDDAIGLNASPQPDGASHYRDLVRDQLADYQRDMEVERLANSYLGSFFALRNASLRPMTSLRDVDLPGVIHESGSDASSRRAPTDATARVMTFIRRGSGANIDDSDPRDEAREPGERVDHG